MSQGRERKQGRLAASIQDEARPFHGEGDQGAFPVTVPTSKSGPVSAPDLSHPGCVLLPGGGGKWGEGGVEGAGSVPSFRLKSPRYAWCPHRAVPLGGAATADSL